MGYPYCLDQDLRSEALPLLICEPHGRLSTQNSHSAISGYYKMSQHITNSCDLSEADRLTYLAHWRAESGDYVLAAAWLQRAVALKQLAQNIDPVEIADDFYTLGLLYVALEDDFNAERFLSKALQHQKKHLGDQHPDTLETISALTGLACTQDVYAYVQAPHLLDLKLSENMPVPIPERRKVRNAS